ncbi:MAG: DsbA family protein [Sneathiellales bacterium]|nr:DsbA family protein [Sneathiellales bacterium]
MFELYIDFKCPASYLALQPTVDLAAKLDVDIHFGAFDSKQVAIPVKAEKENKSETHIRVRAEQSRNIHKHYAKLQGLKMNFPDQPGNTFPALAVLADWQGDPLSYIRVTFASYWEKGADLGSHETVLALASKAGRDLTVQELENSCRFFREKLADTKNSPVFTTPTYLVKDQIFVGRENLPWITEILKQASNTPFK